MNTQFDDRPTFRGTLRLLFGVLVLISTSGLSIAQDDDPFGSLDSSGDSGFGDSDFGDSDSSGFGFGSGSEIPDAASTSVSSGSMSDPIERDPLVFILRENPPETPREFGRAIGWMAKLGYWSEAGKLLDRVASAKWNLAHRAELAREAGASTWLRLRKADVTLSEAQRNTVHTIFEAPASLARDPGVIDRQIDQLADPDPGKRRQAQLQLQDADSAAIERLVNRLIDGDSKVLPDILAGTIVEFGSEGIEALQAACAMSDLASSSRAMLAVSELPSNHFPSELATALYSLRYPVEFKHSMAERLARQNRKLPDERATSEFVRRAFDNALVNYQNQRLVPHAISTTVWRPSPDGTRIVATEGTKESKALERLAQLALLRATHFSATPTDQATAGAVLLQRSYQLDPNHQATELDSALIGSLTEGMGDPAGYWPAIFDQASKWEMHGACVRTLQLVRDQVASGQMSPPLDFLSKLLADPRSAIRYRAFDMIAAIDPKSGYAGSDRALATAIEILNLGGGPQALVVGANLEWSMIAEGAIRDVTGGQVITVTAGRDALRELSGSNPIELIFLVDRVHDMSLFELLQRLRKTSIGGSLPIAVLTDKLYDYEQKWIDSTSGVVASILSSEPESMKLVIHQMLSSLDTEPLSSEERARFVKSAESFLANIAADRITYSFYPMDDWQQSLVRLPASVSSNAQLQVLSGMGTSQSQLRLVQLVAALGATEAQRVDAARAFETSIRRFGNRLSQQDVQSAYDLYNRLGPNDTVIARTMSFVLDIIEAQAGTKDWPTEP